MGMNKELPVVSLVLLVIGIIVFIIGVALPYWLIWDGINAGLWHSCPDSCMTLSYNEFSVNEINDTTMREYKTHITSGHAIFWSVGEFCCFSESHVL